ncbi:MAG TPA: MoaD/ThiS family protein [bacterium]|nr:MoaD/ThiS family protein [bacterium]
MVTVHIPALLRDLTGGAAQVQLDLPDDAPVTVRRLLEHLDERHRGLLEALLYEGDLMPGIAVFIDNDQAMMGLQAKVGPQSDVHFIPPVVGGH